MDIVTSVLLGVLWFGVVVAAVYFVALRITRNSRNAGLLAGGATLVFLLGSIVHPTTLVVESGAPTAAPVATSAIVPMPVTPAQPAKIPPDAQTDRLTNRGESAVASIDFVGFVGAGAPQARASNGNVFPLGSTIVLTGWAADDIAKRPAFGVFLLVDGTGRYRDPSARYGTPRADVARVKGTPAYLNTGFKMTIPARILGMGHHLLQLAMISSDKRSFYVFPARVEVDVQ